jgi:uncharacterized protein YjdB
MRTISFLSLAVAALSCSLACGRNTQSNTPLMIAGPTVVARPVSLDIIGERQLMVGQAVTLRAFATMSDGSRRDVSADARWQSSNSVVCSAQAGGVIVAASAGICDVSASFDSIATTASFAVVTSAWTGEIISIEVQGPRTLSVGQGDRYLVVANTPDGSQIDVTASVTFESSNPSVADVDRDGRVVAMAEGSTTITVTAGGVQVAFRVTILPAD